MTSDNKGSDDCNLIERPESPEVTTGKHELTVGSCSPGALFDVGDCDASTYDLSNIFLDTETLEHLRGGLIAISAYNATKE